MDPAPNAIGEVPSAASTAANDGAVDIRTAYAAPRREAHAAWVAERLAPGPPFRPRFMVYSGHGSPRMTAERLRCLQELGAESFLIATDLPAQLGIDPDHELAAAQVGRAGVSCATLDDFRAICAELDFAAVESLGMLANSIGHVGLGMVASVIAERGNPQVRLVMQNDPLKEFTARGTEIFTPEQSVRIAMDAVAYAIDEALPGYAITVCSNHYDVAGAGPVFATGLAFANAIVYMDELVGRGYDAAAAAQHMMFFLNERSDLFVGAAIFRLARELWSDVLRDRYGVRVGDQPVLALMGYAHGLETALEPLVNVPRCAISVAAAVMGGADYLCAAAYDEALRVPSPDAAALALRTMQVVGTEHGIATTVDPLFGSVKLAAIEDEVRSEIDAVMEVIRAKGGALACVANGVVARLIDEGRERRERQLRTGERTWVGVNEYEAPQHRPLFAGASTRVATLGQEERELVAHIRSHKRTAEPRVAGPLDEVRRVAASDENLLPATVAALQAGATGEQIVSATRAGFHRR